MLHRLPLLGGIAPIAGQAIATVFELADGEYNETGHVPGGQPWDASRPFPVRVVPADLVRGLRALTAAHP